MRKSNKILLSTVFLAAVAAGKASAQQASDTTSTRHHSHGSFFHWPHWGRSAKARSGMPASSSPRSGGFGNSIRSASPGS